MLLNLEQSQKFVLIILHFFIPKSQSISTGFLRFNNLDKHSINKLLNRNNLVKRYISRLFNLNNLAKHYNGLNRAKRIIKHLVDVLSEEPGGVVAVRVSIDANSKELNSV